MKYAVVARIFNSGKIVARVRPAEEGETSRCVETRTCDVWVDIFDTKMEAIQFCNDYRKA